MIEELLAAEANHTPETHDGVPGASGGLNFLEAEHYGPQLLDDGYVVLMNNVTTASLMIIDNFRWTSQ